MTMKSTRQRTHRRARSATVEIVDDAEPKRPRRARRKSGGKVEGKTPKRRLDRKPRGGNGDATSAAAPVSGRRRGGFLGSGGLFGGNTLRSLRPRLR
jgi:hypothetical protein